MSNIVAIYLTGAIVIWIAITALGFILSNRELKDIIFIDFEIFTEIYLGFIIALLWPIVVPSFIISKLYKQLRKKRRKKATLNEIAEALKRSSAVASKTGISLKDFNLLNKNLTQ